MFTYVAWFIFVLNTAENMFIYYTVSATYKPVIFNYENVHSHGCYATNMKVQQKFPTAI
jgi:hypothetical protein